MQPSSPAKPACFSSIGLDFEHVPLLSCELQRALSFSSRDGPAHAGASPLPIVPSTLQAAVATRLRPSTRRAFVLKQHPPPAHAAFLRPARGGQAPQRRGHTASAGSAPPPPRRSIPGDPTVQAGRPADLPGPRRSRRLLSRVAGCGLGARDPRSGPRPPGRQACPTGRVWARQGVGPARERLLLWPRISCWATRRPGLRAPQTHKPLRTSPRQRRRECLPARTAAAAAAAAIGPGTAPGLLPGRQSFVGTRVLRPGRQRKGLPFKLWARLGAGGPCLPFIDSGALAGSVDHSGSAT